MLERTAIPVILELMEPGALLQEIVTKRNDRRVRQAWAWQADAIWALLEDGTADEIRTLLHEVCPEPEAPFRDWIEELLAVRETPDTSSTPS